MSSVRRVGIKRLTLWVHPLDRPLDVRLYEAPLADACVASVAAARSVRQRPYSG